MAYLQAKNGPESGKTYSLGNAKTVLGRHPDCDIVVDVGAVSRQHAQILFDGTDYTIEDLKSRNGTFLNGADSKLTGTHTLKHGDVIRLCDVSLAFSHEDDAVALEDSTLVEESSSFISAVVTSEEPKPKSLSDQEYYAGIAQKLERNHVHCPDVDSREVANELQLPNSKFREILLGSFHKILILDAKKGMTAFGIFKLPRFLLHASHQMAEAFGLSIEGNDYHPEEVFQVLKDEPRSLFIFLNFNVVPADVLRHLRGFTQDKHHCLFCGPNDLDGINNETQLRLSGATDSQRSRVTATPQVKLQALIDITHALSQSLSLDEVFPRVLDTLFEIFFQADRGFIVLRTEQGELVPKWTKVRHDDDNQMFRVSRTIIQEVMSTQQAILSADAASDERFDLSLGVADFRIRSMMCAPLINGEGSPIGVLQVDTLDQNNRFLGDDLELLATVALQASMAIDNAIMRERALHPGELEAGTDQED